MAYSVLSPVLTCLCLILVALFTKSLAYAYTDPLQKVPGSWLARLTRFWLASTIASRKYHKTNIRLHQKYGPVVRIAPNEYSIDDLEASKIIYRARDPLPKVSLLRSILVSYAVVQQISAVEPQASSHSAAIMTAFETAAM